MLAPLFLNAPGFRFPPSGFRLQRFSFLLRAIRVPVSNPTDEANRNLRHVTPKTLQKALYVGFFGKGQPPQVVWPEVTMRTGFNTAPARPKCPTEIRCARSRRFDRRYQDHAQAGQLAPARSPPRWSQRIKGVKAGRGMSVSFWTRFGASAGPLWKRMISRNRASR